MGNENPKVFISYSWEDEEHKDWVRCFTDKLITNGIDATLDQYDLTLGDRLPQFMEQSIKFADYVLIICTPAYKEKSDSRKGGVGYEGDIISDELLKNSFEIFVKTPDYDRHMEQIQILLSEIGTAFQTNPELDELISAFAQFLDGCGKSQSGLAASGSIVKGLGKGNKLNNIAFRRDWKLFAHI